MKVIFINPQGNFDKEDSHLTEHPDFGGQLIYVKEVAMALSEIVDVDIVTRRIIDDDWPKFSEKIDYFPGYNNLRIVRIPFGGDKFLKKEDLWEHIPEFVNNIISFYENEFPEFATAHYADGGYAVALLKKITGINFTFTGHSLGAQKLDKLNMNLKNYELLNNTYCFNKRIAAERLSIKYASKIITSTSQERLEQYSHPLYFDSAEVNNDQKFSIIPPGVNEKIFNCKYDFNELEHNTIVKIEKIVENSNKKPFIILSSRLDEKKNHFMAVKAYVNSKKLQKKANFAIFLRNIKNPYDLDSLMESEKKILKPIIELITENNLQNNFFFFDLRSQLELATAYKYFAKLKSVFLLTAYYEPFGLAPIEAGACGLAVVATKNGGPQEIFEDGSGLLVDPEDHSDISQKLMITINNFDYFSKKIINRVKEKYTWKKTAEGYLKIIEKSFLPMSKIDENISELNAEFLIKNYLRRAIP